MNVRSLYIYLSPLILLLHGCFTGVESTPRITYSDVKKVNIQTSPEQRFLSDIIPDAPAAWPKGKSFFVADPKIALIFTSEAPIDTAKIVGEKITLRDISPVMSMLGEDVALFDFATPTGQTLSYKSQVPYQSIDTIRQLEIPFAIDCDFVDKISELIKGNEYYIVTPMWYDGDGRSTVKGGLRHVPVHVVDVVPGNANFPVRVIFKPIGSDGLYSVYMSVGNKRSATRNFDTLFAFDNPRNQYPHITDDTWQLIIHSQVKLGMTRDECRLALGTPPTRGERPTSAGMVEYWSYPDGVFLIFEDGYLSSFRH